MSRQYYFFFLLPSTHYFLDVASVLGLSYVAIPFQPLCFYNISCVPTVISILVLISTSTSPFYPTTPPPILHLVNCQCFFLLSSYFQWLLYLFWLVYSMLLSLLYFLIYLIYSSLVVPVLPIIVIRLLSFNCVNL